MTILRFLEQFPDEHSCREHFRQQREHVGINCKKCGCKKRYATVWSLMHRIRNAMGNRDALYTLKGEVEFDEAYFEKATPQGIRLKRGKGSQRQQNVAVMAESTPLQDINTGKQSKHCRYFKMKVVKGHSSEGIDEVVEENIDERAIVFSDQSNTYLLSKHIRLCGSTHDL